MQRFSGIAAKKHWDLLLNETKLSFIFGEDLGKNLAVCGRGDNLFWARGATGRRVSKPPAPLRGGVTAPPALTGQNRRAPAVVAKPKHARKTAAPLAAAKPKTAAKTAAAVAGAIIKTAAKIGGAGNNGKTENAAENARPASRGAARQCNAPPFCCIAYRA